MLFFSFLLVLIHDQITLRRQNLKNEIRLKSFSFPSAYITFADGLMNGILQKYLGNNFKSHFWYCLVQIYMDHTYTEHYRAF